jgi:alkylmercury lyase
MKTPTEEKLAVLERQWRIACPHLFALSLEERQAALLLLRELAKGEAIASPDLVRVLGVPPRTAEALLKETPLAPMVYWDDARRVAGFWGLSTIRTRHRLEIRGRTVWSWCAQDSLFLPELLGETANIESWNPESSEPIRLKVSPARIEGVEPAGVVVSMVSPDTIDKTSAARIIATACHYIFFFGSHESAELWVGRHPGLTILSIDEAFAFGKRLNALLLARGLEAGKGPHE